jgi:hypothetical protein
MASNKKTVSVYADDDLLTALEAFKDSGNHKSLNIAIVAILREKLFGEVSDNVQSKVQSTVQSTLDIEAMITAAIEKQIKELREEFEEHEAIYQAQCQKGFELQVSTFRDEMSEAIATAKKPLLSVMREKVIAA